MFSAENNDVSITDPAGRSSVASVRSTIYEHVEENGRTYHRFKEGSKCFTTPAGKPSCLSLTA